MNKFKLALVSVGTTGLGLLTALVAKADTLSTSTLGTAIDNTSSTWYDYFLVFMGHAWPFVLGGGVLVGIVIFGKRLLHALFSGR